MQSDFLIRQASLQVTSDLNALETVLAWLEQFNHPDLTQEAWWQYQVVVAEGFTNAARHAHRDLPVATPIILEVQLYAQAIEIRIWDQGAPFDLLGKLADLLHQQPLLNPLEQESGRGLLFLHRLTDELSYCPVNPRGNCLVLRKHLAIASASRP